MRSSTRRWPNNLDVKLAIARVDEARGLAAFARSELFPSLDLNAGASRSKISGRRLAAPAPGNTAGVEQLQRWPLCSV
jgi:outer membrane protein TolC